MTHYSETDLALYAGGDLAWWRQWRAERHVGKCSECQQVASGYSELRSACSAGIEALPAEQMPVQHWSALASEMKANIRLGLAAGECVGVRSTPKSMVSGMRLVVAGTVLMMLVAFAAWTNRPDVLRAGAAGSWERASSGTVLEASSSGDGSGIQVRGTQQTLRIMNPQNRNVTYSMGPQGELRARSLDLETGNVTMVHVYGE